MHEIFGTIRSYLPLGQGSPYDQPDPVNTIEDDERSNTDREVPQLNQLTKCNARLEGQLEELKKRLASSDALLENSRGDAERWEMHANQWEKAYREELELGSKAKKNFERQMEEKEAELESLRAFLDTHDHVDATTIAEQLGNINDLVEQLASDLVFRWDRPKNKVIPYLEDTVRRHMARVLGNGLFQALLVCDVHDDGAPSLLQYAIQVVLVGWIVKLFQERRDPSLHAVSERIRQDEIQPVYGRWRCLTHHYLRLTEGPELVIKHTTHFEYDVYFSVRYTMLLFGLPLPNQTFEAVKSELRPLLLEIATKTIELTIIATESVVSKDYTLYKPSSGIFDSHSMETPFLVPAAPEVDEVIGAVGLGMTSVGKPGRHRTEPEVRVFRRAVVITKLTLEELVRPGSTRRKGDNCEIARKGEEDSQGLVGGGLGSPSVKFVDQGHGVSARDLPNPSTREARAVEEA